jgi:hypothetical protein
MMRVAFEEMPWETSPAGVRFKVQKIGARQPRALTDRVRMIFVENVS